MTSITRFLVVAGIAVIVTGAAPASAAVLTTSPVWGDAIPNTFHVCNVVNVSTTPLSATSKVEILDSTGTVLNSDSLAGLLPGQTRQLQDFSFTGFEWCRYTVASAKKVRGNISVLFFDGSKWLTLAFDAAR